MTDLEYNISKKDFNLLKSFDSKTFIHFLNFMGDKIMKEQDVVQTRFVNELLFEKFNEENICKVFKIDEDLNKLLLDTENKCDKLNPLPFKSIFIPNEIVYENIIVKGINVFQHELVLMFTIFLMDLKDRAIYIFTFDENTYKEKISFYPKRQIKLIEFIRSYFNNVLDLLNSNEEIEEVLIKGNTLQENEKRLKKNKYPKLNYTIIKPIKKLKVYVNEYSKNKKYSSLSYRFIVRGHFRELKSSRYKHKKKVWIKPFIKGKGIFINKEYHIEK